jgi:SAM-dependent methyltransferase
MLSPVNTMPFEPQYTANLLRRLARDGGGPTIALGAGQRTIESLQADPAAAHRAIQAIVDDDPARVGRSLCGFTVQAARDFVAHDVKRVLICSEMFEQQLTQRARELFGSAVEIVTAFDRNASLASTLAHTQCALRDQWDAPNDREALWLAADRLMSELIALLVATPEWRYGPQRQLAEFRELCSAIGGIENLRDCSLLNAGCGRYHPLGQSVLAVLAGASRTCALDLEAPLDTQRTARATADLIADVLLDPSTFAAPRSELLQRIEPHLDLAQLQQRNLARAIRNTGVITHHVGSMTDQALAHGPFDIIISRDVFEHMHNITAALTALHGRLNPGGMLIAWIDFSDHRRYANPQRFSHWSNLTMDTDPTCGSCETCAGDTNRLRFPHYAELFVEAGFEVLQYSPTETEPIPAHVRTQLAPMYREMTDGALSVSRALAALRRKAPRHRGAKASNSQVASSIL